MFYVRNSVLNMYAIVSPTRHSQCYTKCHIPERLHLTPLCLHERLAISLCQEYIEKGVEGQSNTPHDCDAVVYARPFLVNPHTRHVGDEVEYYVCGRK